MSWKYQPPERIEKEVQEMVEGTRQEIVLASGLIGYILSEHPDGRPAKPAGFKYQRASAQTQTPTAGVTTMEAVWVEVPNKSGGAPWLNEMANSIELNPFTGVPQVRYQTLVNAGFVIERGTPFSKFDATVVGLDVTPDGEVIDFSALAEHVSDVIAGPVAAATGGAFVPAEA